MTETKQLSGPLICGDCFTKYFGKYPLPEPTLTASSPIATPIKVPGVPIDVTGFSMFPLAALLSSSAPPETSIMQYAISNSISADWFTWGPRKYLDLWIEAWRNGKLLAYSKTITKTRPPQGFGLYIAPGMMNSATYCDTIDSRLMLVKLNNVPCLDLLKPEQVRVLAQLLHIETDDRLKKKTDLLDKLDNNDEDGMEYCYKYGNYARLTASKNVTLTYKISEIKAIITEAKYNHGRTIIAGLNKPEKPGAVPPIDALTAQEKEG